MNTHGGETLHASGPVDLNTLVRFARAAGLPFLGWVDHHDDTRFTNEQLDHVIPELQQLIATGPPEVVDAARDLLSMTEIVPLKPHRYLIFNGD